MEQNKEQDQGDGLAAETRQLLDAATQGPWQWVTNVTDTPVAPGSEHPNARSGDEDLSLRTVAEYPTRSVGPLPIFVINRVDEMHEVQLADGSWSWPDAELIAAAPRLLANWLACGQADDRQVQALIDANRDLADENRALRELTGFLIDACATHRIDVPINSSLLELAADIAGGGVLAAADRGDTDGDRNEGDER